MTNATRLTEHEARFAELAARLARAAQPDAVVCVTESGTIVESLSLSQKLPVFVASAERETCGRFSRRNLEVIRLPIRSADKYRQALHALAVALKSGRVSVGQLVLCAVAPDVLPGQGDLIVVTHVEPGAGDLALTDLVRLTDGIRPTVLEAALSVAARIGQVVRRGKPVGAIFTLGDSIEVLKGSRQLIPNPFRGRDRKERMLTDSAIHGVLVELSKLDGAFVVRGDGFIQTAGVFLAATKAAVEVSPGLGARHVAAAAVTARTLSTAVVVSSTDGNIRVFVGGAMVLRMDSEVPL